MPAVIELAGAARTYGGAVPVHALKPTDLAVGAGELVVILGPSGSGKSTLLNLVGGLDAATAGTVRVAGHDLAGLDEGRLCAFRRERVGFVFQFFNLVAALTVRENVSLAAELRGLKIDVDALVRQVGLAGLEDRFPGELSGGQQQRVAVARALAKDPDLLLCDEPTGALDEETGKQVLGLLEEAARVRGRTVLVVTHHGPVAALADRVLRLKDGRIQSDQTNPRPLPARDLAW